MLSIYCPLATTGDVDELVEARAIVFRDRNGKPLTIPYFGGIMRMEDIADDVVRNFTTRALQRDIPLLKEHMWGEAIGWVERLEKRDDGVYASIRLTEDGRELLRKGSYRYVSPGLAKDYVLSTGDVVYGWAMIELSVTNFPAQTELARVLLSEEQLVVVQDNPERGGLRMDEQKLQELLQSMALQIQQQLDAKMEERLAPIRQVMEEQRKLTQAQLNQQRIAQLSQRIQSWRFRRHGDTVQMSQDGDMVIPPAVAEQNAKLISLLPEDQQEEAMAMLQATPTVLVPLSTPAISGVNTAPSAKNPQEAAQMLALAVRKVRTEHPDWDADAVWQHVAMENADLVKLYEQGGAN